MGTPKRHFFFGALAAATVLTLAFFGYRKLATRWDPETYDLRDDILVHGNVDLKEIALTFDDGPNPATARDILNILGKEQVKATFFVVGKKVEENPRLVRRMLAEGHEVANHTYSHPRLDGLTAAQIREEIARCGHAVEKAAGVGMNLFRPPGMRYDDVVIDTAQDLGYVTVHWNAAAQDFRAQDPERIVAKIRQRTQPGSVILLHGHPDTVKALPEIIRELKSQGYRFVRVSRMLARLPRPVYVRTNAYGQTEDELASISEPESKPPVSSRRRPISSHTRLDAPSIGKAGTPARRGVDVPAWN